MATAYVILPVYAFNPDVTTPCGVSFFNSKPQLDFDAATKEYAHVCFKLPANYASDPVVKGTAKMASAQTGTNKVDIEMAVFAAGAGDSIASDSYDTVNAVTVTLTNNLAAGVLFDFTLTLTNFDTASAGDWIGLRLARDAADATNDTATGDLQVVGLVLEYTTT